MDGVRPRLAVTLPWSLLPRRFGFFGAIARTPVSGTITAITTVEPVAAVAAPFVAVPIAFGPAHHGRRPFLVGVNPDREVAQNVFVEALQPFDLVDRRRRGVDVHQREMRFAVLAQPVGEGLHPPVFGLLDRAAEPLDDAFQLRGQFLHLLRAGVLARKVDVFVKRHECPFLVCHARPGAKPLEPFGKGSNALKAGTPDAGPRMGPTVIWNSRPSVQPPAGVERKPGLYAAGPKRQDASKARSATRILDDFGEPHREFNAFAQLPGVSAAGRVGPAELFHAREQGFEALSSSLWRNARSLRARNVGICDRRKTAHENQP